MSNQLELIKQYIDHADLKNEEISHWSIGQQIEHILLTDKEVLQHIIHHFMFPPEEGNAINLLGYLMLYTGYIPRGKGNAPTNTIPKKRSKQNLYELYEQVSKLYQQTEEKKTLLDQSLYAFPHPYFGMLTIKQWIRFLNIHTKHHVKIIRELLRSSPPNS